MPYKLLIIAKNTFVETLRQPIFSVIIVFALFLYLISPSITMYTLDADQDLNLLRELGLSTLFLSGLFISIFAASGAVTEEIESRTITTVLSKPIGRPTFLIGKFLGIMAAVSLAHYIGTLAYLMTVRHGILFEAADTHDMTVIIAAAVAVLGAVLIGAFLNYSYDWNFPASAMSILAILGTLGVVFLAFIDRDWTYNPANNRFTAFDLYGSALLYLAIMVLVALAVLFSTRFNIVVTLTCTVGVFLLGLVSDWFFGQHADSNFLARIATILVPNLQVFWATDVIYSIEGQLSPVYIGMVAIYAILYTAGILFLATSFFQKRQVG